MQRKGKRSAGKEHRGWHDRTRPDAAIDAQPQWLVVALTLVAGAPASRVILMLHVILTCLCGVLHGRHPGPGHRADGRGWGQSRVGHTSSARNPALGPWA